MFVFLPLLAGIMMLMYWRPRHVPYVQGLNLAIFCYFAWYMYRSLRTVYHQGRALTVSKLALLAFLSGVRRADAGGHQSL